MVLLPKSSDHNSQNNNDKSAVSSRTLHTQDLLQSMVETVESVYGWKVGRLWRYRKSNSHPMR
jgi:hypothetical protein